MQDTFEFNVRPPQVCLRCPAGGEVRRGGLDCLFREMAENLPEVLYIADLRIPRTLFVSRAYEELWGRSRQSLYDNPLSFLDAVHPDDFEQAKAVLDVFAGELPDREYRIIRPDGSIRWVRDRVWPVRDPDGSIRHVVGMAQDITEQRQAQDKLRARNELLQTMFDRLPVMLCLFDKDLRPVMVNRELERVLGWNLQDFIERDILRECYPDEQKRQAVRDFIAAAHSQWIYQRPRARNGTWVDTCWTNVRLSDGSTIGIGQDITQRLRREELQNAENRMLKRLGEGGSLQQALSELAQLIQGQSQAMRCSVMLLDDDGKHLRCAAAAGLPDDYIQGINGLEIGPTSGSCGTAAFTGQRVIVQDIAADPLWQSYRDFAMGFGLRACWSQPIIGAGNRILGAFAGYYDEPRTPGPSDLELMVAASELAAWIIERKRSSDLERERNALKTAVSAQERVLQVLGHELRTPMAAIRGMAEFLLVDGAANTPEFSQFLQNIQEQVVQMTSMVNDLLDVARLTSGTADWSWSEFSLGQACADAIDQVRPLVDGSRVSMNLELENGDVTMRGDQAAVSRMALNLISNAQKHTASGSIQVSVGSSDKPAGRWVCLRVRDTGEGIPQETAQKLGQAFALSSGMTGENYVKGSGLGLVICKGIAQAHGGTVTIESKPGEGTSVTVRMQADLPAPQSPRTEKPSRG